MTRFNPTQIANRIGRITPATALAGILMMVVSVPFRAIDGDLPSVTSPIELFGTTLFELLVISIAAVIFVPPAVLALWILKRRYPHTTAWKALTVLAAVVAVGYVAAGTSSTLLEYATSTIATAGYAVATLSSITVSESIFAGQLGNDLSTRQLATGYGSVVLALFVLVVVAAASAGAAGVVADSAGLEWNEEENPDQFSDAEFESEYGHLTDIEDADAFVCAGENERTEGLIDRPAADHHQNDLSEWDVDVTIEERFSGTYLEATFEPDSEYGILDATAPSGSVSWSGDDVTVEVIDSETAADDPGTINERTVTFDVVSDDGFDRDALVDGGPDDLESTTEPTDDGDEADDNQDGDRNESDGEPDDGTETDTGDRPAVHEATLDELTCEITADLPDDPETDYAVSGTESLEESEIDVQYAEFDHEVDGETVTDRGYAIPFDEEIVGVKATAETNSTEPIAVVFGSTIEVSTEMGVETRVWVDTINEDGAVVRHQFDLCPSVEDS
ncbi:hypothetical protein [Natronorubrum sp. FCH18a]|uniref:hypothetical protein n=1 Tax=Natronorubrum sp. FCH18a TaxID=3447018 RepID=UPI003F510567